ncbi:hypothetical protein, partial [Leuconostoc mesenteroides]|uniref:hypothetical protein n=1 Tax=Leuconostoc mesenteroides TaxID=1245 RepID=UPI001CA5BEA8
IYTLLLNRCKSTPRKNEGFLPVGISVNLPPLLVIWGVGEFDQMIVRYSAHNRLQRHNGT